MKKIVTCWLTVGIIACSFFMVSAEQAVSKEIKSNYELAVSVLISKNLLKENELIHDDSFDISPWVTTGVAGEKYFRDLDDEGVTLLINKEGFVISYYNDDARDILNIYDYYNGEVKESTMDMGKFKKELSMEISGEEEKDNVVDFHKIKEKLIQNLMRIVLNIICIK